MDRRAALLFAGLAFAWGIPYLLIKIAVDELDPAVLVLARTALASLVLLPVAFARHAVAPVLRRWVPLLGYTVSEIAVPWLFLNHAEQVLPSSTTGLLLAATPLVGVGIAFVTGRAERMGRTGWAGLLIGLLGVTALVGLDVTGSARSGLLEMLVVVIGYAIGPVILVRHLADLPGVGVVAVSIALVALVYVPIVLLGPGLPSERPSGDVVLSVVLLALICTVAAFLVFFTLTSLIGPVRTTTITYVAPAVAIVAGAVVLDERITGWTVAGFALVLVGSYLVTKRPKAQDPVSIDGVTPPATATGTSTTRT